AAQRNALPRLRRLLHALHDIGGQPRADRPGADRVHADAVAPVRGGHRARQREHRALAGRISVARALHRPAERRNRGDVDDRAAGAPHVRHGRARHQVDRAHVDVLREVPVLERDALHGAADDHRADTGVVEEDVEAAEGADGARDDRGAVVRLLKVRDARASRDFYTRTLGLKVSHEDLEHGAVFLSFGREHHELALFQLATGEPPDSKQPGLHHMAWQVGSFAELQAAYRELCELGVAVESTIEHNVSRSVYFRDPDGNRVELY